MRSKQTSERCKRTSEWTSEWPSTSVCISGYSGPRYDALLIRYSLTGAFYLCVESTVQMQNKAKTVLHVVEDKSYSVLSESSEGKVNVSNDENK